MGAVPRYRIDTARLNLSLSRAHSNDLLRTQPCDRRIAPATNRTE